MKRYILLLLALFLVPTVLADVCCVDAANNQCNSLSQCTGDQEEIDTGFGLGCLDVPECYVGCCCQNADTIAPFAWNSEADNVERINSSCDLKGNNFTWSEYPAGTTCVDFCLGQDTTTPPPEPDEYTLSGTVSDGETPLSSATVFFPYVNSPFQDTTESSGEFVINNVPAWDGFATATRAGCDPSRVHIDLTEDTEITFEMNCGLIACEPTSKPNFIESKTIRGESTAHLVFSADESCGSPDYYHLVRTHRSLDTDNPLSGGITITPILSKEYDDTGLEPNTEYCYRLAAHYQSGLHPATLDERAEACITTGAAECMGSSTTSWCGTVEGDSAVMRCDQDNTLEVTSCTDGQMCAHLGGDAYGCVVEPPCDKCNGLFGKLSNIIFGILFQGVTKECPELDGYCFEDKTNTPIDAYRSCSEVTSCENYLSADACASNDCVLPTTCNWKDISPFEEIGAGVCRSNDQPATCSACEDIFGTCNKELCEAIGERPGGNECYYDGMDNGLDYSGVASRCVHKDDMACRYYDTQNDCTGGTQVELDVQYTGSERNAGTHNIDTPSQDTLGIGLCDWSPVSTYPSGGRCFKDADQKPASVYDDDCIESGYYAESGYQKGCFQDATPPVTNIVISDQVVPIHEITDLQFVLSDNFYAEENLQTKFCIQNASLGPCYPSMTLVDAVAALPDMDIGDTGSFIISYYSFDRSGNLEIVNELQVTLLELGYPRLEDADLR